MAELKSRTVFVQPTTGGRIEVCLPPQSSVNHLKLVVAKRLKVSKDKIVILHKNKQLTEGTLEENNIAEGAKLTLLPNVETGLASQNPEQCVMQALETLNETQVDSFLAGRSPLNLTIRLGDHMMFIQLQLSTILPSTTTSTAPTTTTPTTTTPPPTPPTTPTATSSPTPPFLSVVSGALPTPPPSPRGGSPPKEPAEGQRTSAPSTLSNKILAEASRNLTQTLRQLSSSALTKKMNESCDGRCCIARRQGGAVIESMYHHGRGVFSGTFSGTLSPLLQDKDGRPRRNICTIIHILNDLLGASSHCNPSAQCLCSSSTTTTHTNAQKNPPPTDVKDEETKLDENRILRQKVQHIQTMLKERRQNRSARRQVRSSPYPSSRQTPPPSARNFDTDVFHPTLPSDCNDQTLMDYSSSETAVA